MGEAKRRKAQDPSYGKVKQKRSDKKKRFDISKISRTELIIWAVLLGMVLSTFIWSYQIQ
ncbi:MAG: hypothetical protein F6J97_11750 [Leptolyngbya sp. SIO4C1]|nr:hypothetical protein [Leptolyngbya sp. SIO4C1]